MAYFVAFMMQGSRMTNSVAFGMEFEATFGFQM
jgi:hypothetical protein